MHVVFLWPFDQNRSVISPQKIHLHSRIGRHTPTSRTPKNYKQNPKASATKLQILKLPPANQAFPQIQRPHRLSQKRKSLRTQYRIILSSRIAGKKNACQHPHLNERSIVEGAAGAAALQKISQGSIDQKHIIRRSPPFSSLVPIPQSLSRTTKPFPLFSLPPKPPLKKKKLLVL